MGPGAKLLFLQNFLEDTEREILVTVLPMSTVIPA
jgi:hypothetical protein